jgi:PAS domain S-box-containing protein
LRPEPSEREQLTPVTPELGVETPERERRLSRELEVMNRLHRLRLRCVRAAELSTVLDEVVETAIAITRADMGNLQLLDPDTGVLRIAAQHGHEQGWLDFFSAVEEGLGASCGLALTSGARVIVEDVALSPVFVGTPALEVQLRAGIRAVQSTPLLSSSGALLGMLSTHFRVPTTPDEADLKLLDVLARQTTDVLDRQRLEDERSRFFELSADILAVISIPEWHLQRVNSAMSSVLGWSREQLTEIPLLSLVHPDDRERSRAELARGEPLKAFENRLRCWDGSYKRIAWNTAPRAAGALTYCVGREATEHRDREEALRDSDQRKSKLLAFLSHELRDRLGPFRSSIFLLEHSRPGTVLATHALHVLKGQTERLAQLVEDRVPETPFSDASDSSTHKDLSHPPSVDEPMAPRRGKQDG